MAKSYQNLMGQISKLQEQAAAMRKKEMAGVVAGIHKQMAEFGLTAQDLGFSAGRGAVNGRGKAAAAPKKSTRAGVGVPKYQDPTSGKTWTGMGKPPNWIVGAANRDDFLIDKSAAGKTAAPEAKKAKATPMAAKKTVERARKGAAKKAAPARKGAARGRKAGRGASTGAGEAAQA